MKKFFWFVSLLVLIGSANLFAETYNLGDGWTLTEYNDGSFGLDDNNRGICYDLTISRESSQNNSFWVRAGSWIERKVTSAGLKSAISTVFQKAGVALKYANLASAIIVNIFEPSPAE